MNRNSVMARTARHRWSTNDTSFFRGVRGQSRAGCVNQQQCACAVSANKFGETMKCHHVVGQRWRTARAISMTHTSHGFFTAVATAACALGLFATPVCSRAAPGPVSLYNFDAGTGTTLVDQSGNDFVGTLVNGPTWTSGKYNGGLAFDGVNDYVSMGDVAQADSLTSITVSTWVKFAVNGGGGSETHLIDKSQCNGATNGGPWELGVSLFGSHKAEFVIYPQGGSPSAYLVSGSSTTSIDDGAWHYVTGRYDGSRISVWVDGNLENSRAAAGLKMSNTGSSVELGGYCNGYSRYPFKGALDDMRIYARALTPAEILGDMATPVATGTPPPPPPADTAAPSTPTGLTTSGVTTSQITLSWQASTDNVGVAGYRVYRNGSLAGTSSSTTFTNSGLTSNTSYVFTVTAFDAAGNVSAQSAPQSVSTSPTVTPPPPPSDTTAPSVPTGLSASGVTTSQATLAWQVSTDNVGVSGYRVYRNGSLAGTTASTTFVDSGLTASTTYVFTVEAFDAAGNASSQSAQLSVTTAALSSGQPSSATAAYNFDAGTGTTLVDQSGNNFVGTLVNGPTWTSGKYNGGLSFDGVNDYVSMGDVAQADSLTSITVSTWVKFAVNGGGGSETHLIDKSQCNGATNGGPWELGVSLFGSHKAEFVIYPQGGSPSAYLVSGSSTTSIDDGAWHYVTGRYDGSRISVWVDGNLENSRAAAGLKMSNTGSSVELGGYCNGYSRYPFKGTLDDMRIYARALTPAEILGDMATPVATGTPPPPPPADTAAPSTPTGLTTSGVTTSQITLSWQASTDNVGVAGYRVYRNGSLAGTSSSTTFTNSGLTSNTSYVFTVTAFDAAGNVSAQSAPQSVSTLAT